MKKFKATRFLAVIVALAMLFTAMPLTGLAAEGAGFIGQNDPDALPESWVDNSNEGMFRLQEEFETRKNNAIQLFADADGKARKKVEIAFLVDASGSMAPYIAAVKENVTAFAQYLESADVDLRMSVVRFGSKDDGVRATVLKTNGSSWHTSTKQLVQTLASIPADGGIEALSDAIGDILNKDPVTNLTNVQWSSDAYKFAFVLTNDFDIGVEGLEYNAYGYPTLDSTIPGLQSGRIRVSVVTEKNCYSDYNSLATETGGGLYDIASKDYFELLINYANSVLGIALKSQKAGPTKEKLKKPC